jgi:diguanylate cyclase (GGDEF)-like protein
VDRDVGTRDDGARWLDVLEAVSDAVVVVECDGQVRAANAAARLALGARVGATLDGDELVGAARVALGDGAAAFVVRTASIGATAAIRDPLTGLANRTLLVEALTSALARMSRSGRRPGVMFLDLDGFKAVNDGLGHEAGDMLLIEVANRLVDCVRGSDVVARFGGDEFVVVLEDVPDERVARIVADRILDQLGAPITLDGGTVKVGASIGIALARGDVGGPDDLLAEADAAMYRAKQTGKHRYQLFDDELRARATARAALRRDLEGALDRGEVTATFTPVASADTGRLATLETALRWHHPTAGELGATDFMPLAREHGLARALDHFALRQAARASRDWNATRAPDDAVTVWVTVGAHDLLAGALQSFVAQLVDDATLGPGTLGIEVPLVALAEHGHQAERALQSIAWHGVRVAVDDLGATAFTPSQLQRFHIDTVKLDRRMVADAARTPEALSALAGVIAMGRALDLAVVAKGVESRAQLELLQELGCSLVQGTVVARPQSAGEVVDLLAGPPPWTTPDWPAAAPLSTPMSRMQVLERLLRLRAAA